MTFGRISGFGVIGCCAPAASAPMGSFGEPMLRPGTSISAEDLRKQATALETDAALLLGGGKFKQGYAKFKEAQVLRDKAKKLDAKAKKSAAVQKSVAVRQARLVQETGQATAEGKLKALSSEIPWKPIALGVGGLVIVGALFSRRRR